MKPAALVAGALLILGGFAALTFWADLDLTKWFTCNGPLALPEDQKSNFCRETETVPPSQTPGK